MESSKIRARNSLENLLENSLDGNPKCRNKHLLENLWTSGKPPWKIWD